MSNVNKPNATPANGTTTPATKKPTTGADPLAILSIERMVLQLRTLLQQWQNTPDVELIFSQITLLNNQFDSAFSLFPEKFIAQLHNYKSSVDYTTNLVQKALIITALLIQHRSWSNQTRLDVLAACLTYPLGSLTQLAKLGAGKALTPPEQARVDNSNQLSLQLLGQQRQLNPLWQHCLASAQPRQSASGDFPIGFHGEIICLSYQMAHLLCQKQKSHYRLLRDVVKSLYLTDSRSSTQQLLNVFVTAIVPPYPTSTPQDNDANDQINHHQQSEPAPESTADPVPSSPEQAPLALPIASKEQLCPGHLVILKNRQLAMIMKIISADSYICFLSKDSQLSINGGLVIIGNNHIAKIAPSYECTDRRLYSLIWEKPLEKFAASKDIQLYQSPTAQPAIDHPPAFLAPLLAGLFETANLNQLSEQISQSPELTRLLTRTASETAKKEVLITDTKHAIAMLGLNRLAPLLTRGSLMNILVHYQFPGYGLANMRRRCLLQAVLYYGQYNDLMGKEDLALYVEYYLAALFVSPTLHQTACLLYRQHPLTIDEAFTINGLFHQQLSDEFKQQLQLLIHNWQLPKVGAELLRRVYQQEQSNDKTSSRSARIIEQALAVIQLATIHCNQIFNQVAPKSPYLQQKIQQHLTTLGINDKHYQQSHDQFLQQFSPYIPIKNDEKAEI